MYRSTRKTYLFIHAVVVMIMTTSCTGNNENSTSEAEAIPMRYITSFQFEKPDIIELDYFLNMSDQQDSIAPAKKYRLTDSDKIEQIMALSSKLSDKGDIMVKMGDVPILNVSLIYPDKRLYFTFYQNRIKTPDTSFYSLSPEEEKALYHYLFSLLK